MEPAPLLPRMHLLEIDDQTWFPSFLRARVQSALTVAWNMRVPLLQTASPAQLVAGLLKTHLSPIGDYAFVDFCAGGGGPTPFIEREINRNTSSSINGGSSSSKARTNGDDAGTDADADASDPAPFILTDLHPHVADWAKAAAASPNISYEPTPVDASAAPASLLDRVRAAGRTTTTTMTRGKQRKGAGASHYPRKIFRLFNLAFHHFDDPLARSILKNTLETSDGFGIFELQDRTASAFFTTFLFGVGTVLSAPYYALLWRDIAVPLFFTYIIPILPFVLVFDGWVSGLRTRTPGEVKMLMRECGVDQREIEERWEFREGRVRHMWPCGYLNWIICVKKR